MISFFTQSFSLRLSLFFLVGFFISVVSHAGSLWDVHQQWNMEWERKYGQWFTSTITTDYFKKHNIPTDCADAAIGARWIFARAHGLPVLQHSVYKKNGVRTMYSHNLMTRDWKNRRLKRDLSKPWYEDELFKEALIYVFNNTNTYTLGWDSYPVAINKDSLIPGSHHLTYYPNGAHANIFHSVKLVKYRNVNSRRNRKKLERNLSWHEFSREMVNKSFQSETMAMVMLNSTLPVAVRDLFFRDFAKGGLPVRIGREGFLRMRWPVYKGGEWTHLSRHEHPSFSEEQYEHSFLNGHGSFYQAVMAKMWPKYKFKRADLELIRDYLNLELGERIKVVIDGYNHCVDTEFTCEPGSRDWDKHSTPNRDSRLQNLVTGTVRSLRQLSANNRFKQRVRRFLNGTINLSREEEFNNHQVNFSHILNTFELSPEEFFTNEEETRARAKDDSIEKLFSSDPRTDFEERWGI